MILNRLVQILRSAQDDNAAMPVILSGAKDLIHIIKNDPTYVTKTKISHP